MNHCGRPECECQKRCCVKCKYLRKNWRIDGVSCSNRDCECHEKPVQEGHGPHTISNKWLDKLEPVGEARCLLCMQIEDARREGAEAERSRLLEAVGKLREEISEDNDIEWSLKHERYKVLNAVLKILSGEEIKS